MVDQMRHELLQNLILGQDFTREDLKQGRPLLGSVLDHLLDQIDSIRWHLLSQSWKDFLISDTFMNFTELLVADIMVSKHVQEHDSQRENISLEAVPLASTLALLLRSCEPQSTDTCCEIFAASQTQ